MLLPIKVDKHVRESVCWKLLQELKSKPHVFTALPSAGALSPGQRCDVRVRFSPTAEKSYKSSLRTNISQSSQHLQLQVSGHGLEPQLEFCPTVLELGPLLLDSHGAEGTVLVKNPCELLVEFFSLEFDEEYLAEEQILRMLEDYNSQSTSLLPPRAPGEKLPLEVLDYYEDQKRLQDEQGKSKTGEPAGQANGNFEGTQFLSDEGRKPSAGIVHSISSFLVETSPTRWTVNLNVEKRRRKVLRKDTGGAITLSFSLLLCPLWQKGEGLQCHLHHFTAARSRFHSYRP
ncbi:hydrocephalus-inducing protein homolog [Cuculus canorus]|uniref:hydrocephalus-inducing protein homolog n=1 Tax=Cuculus canorus TaxID=55661 RepID=UPI0023AAFB49|nr:hydrocephalus-inducing protein homolog [Cuculus canorus]